jgi:hypothetical protein
MRRSLLLLILLGVVAVGLVALSSGIARRLWVHQLTNSTDDLDWLRQEFSLSETNLNHIRQLHEGYLPKCRDFCERIAAKSRELESLLATNKAVTPDVEQKIRELAAIRAECQTGMLRHFQEVSAAMPPEPGERYFAEMQRLTLGQHQQFERSMSPTTDAHGHH